MTEPGFDLSHDLLCTADSRGHFTSLNNGWERLLGWSREELMAEPLIEFVHPEDRDATANSLQQVDDSGFELAGFENRYRTKEGEWRWLRWTARSDGTTWFGVATDVTRERRAGEQLQRAIDEDRLLAYSQPIADHRSGGIVQEELLVRMREENNGRIKLPGEFLPEAERTGAIGAVDRWMTQRGLELATRGRNVEINLSARTIGDETLMEELTEAVIDAGLSARRVVFEITETTALANTEAARELSERLGRLGCLIALDDFGTGFASLTHLRELPVQIIKIDRSFVSGLRTEPADRALVRGVATMARELQLKTVAEGVEDATTYELLREFEIDRVQGFLIGRPAPI